MVPVTEVQEQRWVGDTASNRGQSTPSIQMLAPNLSTATLSKRVTLPLVPPDGRWKQLSLKFRPYIHELDIPGLKVVVGSGVV